MVEREIRCWPAETPALLELTAARCALKKLKDLIWPDRLKELLEEDTAAGSAGWHDILNQALAVVQSGASHALAEAHLAATVPECGSGNSNSNFTAGNFIGWFAHSAFSHVEKLWVGHPEHYGISISANADGTMGGEILEPWGSLLSNKVAPRFAPVGVPGGGVKKPWMKPWMKPRPDFPL
ncbi:hypothetical protein B0T26DRAFT_800646 [Lasiosphaeria miniovina]|uniref:Uncharacterized protein n=1 Tax=Lasiosphaeria miniovina TaxID=1954250 RepID=A0AA40ATJ0_9PEZI|nr:uncharacterized protein B0T26DRAFT_800646 [Lasiosphaeria miniovina]KAK0721703.1 hypothetical protein B0T26DRAFT_800646 [Lasiosphaeria miniovina]